MPKLPCWPSRCSATSRIESLSYDAPRTRHRGIHRCPCPAAGSGGCRAASGRRGAGARGRSRRTRKRGRCLAHRGRDIQGGQSRRTLQQRGHAATGPTRDGRQSQCPHRRGSRSHARTSRNGKHGGRGRRCKRRGQLGQCRGQPSLSLARRTAAQAQRGPFASRADGAIGSVQGGRPRGAGRQVRPGFGPDRSQARSGRSAAEGVQDRARRCAGPGERRPQYARRRGDRGHRRRGSDERGGEAFDDAPGAGSQPARRKAGQRDGSDRAGARAGSGPRRSEASGDARRTRHRPRRRGPNRALRSAAHHPRADRDVGADGSSGPCESPVRTAKRCCACHGGRRSAGRTGGKASRPPEDADSGGRVVAGSRGGGSSIRNIGRSCA